MRPTGALGQLGLVGLLAVVGLTGCDTGTDGGGWDPDAQFAPSLRPAVGVRVSDGELRLWTGTPCQRVTRLTLTFDPSTGASVTWEIRSRQPDGAAVQDLRLDRPPRGFRLTKPLPVGYDWHDADRLVFAGDGADGVWGTNTELDVVRDGSADHADDVYYFDQVGWLDRAGVRERNGEEFLTPCTSDPNRDDG